MRTDLDAQAMQHELDEALLDYRHASERGLWLARKRVDAAIAALQSRLVAPIVINVEDFGAKGDGVTDDTAAVQAAVDYAFSVGEPVAPAREANLSYGPNKTPWRITEPHPKKPREIVDFEGNSIARLTVLDMPNAEFIVAKVNHPAPDAVRRETVEACAGIAERITTEYCSANGFNVETYQHLSGFRAAAAIRAMLKGE